MIVYSCWYGNKYRRMARVLAASLRANCPEATLEIKPMGVAAQAPGHRKHVTDNTAKLDKWNKVAQSATEPVVFLDADMLVLGDLAGAFEQEFDVAYTVRPGDKPVNAGAIYMRPTDAARAFFLRWRARNADLLAGGGDALEPLIERYGGINQAALCLLLEEGATAGAAVVPLPCRVWNCCKQTWADFDETTVVVHYTGPMRRQCCEGRMPPDDWAPERRAMMTAWLYYA